MERTWKQATVAYFKVSFWHLAGGTKETHKNVCKLNVNFEIKNTVTYFFAAYLFVLSWGCDGRLFGVSIRYCKQNHW
jgi:hypothetical protein